LLPLMWVAEAGRRLPAGEAIMLSEGMAGIICAGPNLDLLPGRYRLALEIDAVEQVSGERAPEERTAGAPTGAPEPDPLALVVSTGDLRLAERTIRGRELAGAPVALEFGVTEELAQARCPLTIEAVLRTTGRVRGILRAVWLETLPGAPEPPTAEREWLPAMSVGCGSWAVGGRPWRRRSELRAATGKPGHVVFGPYVGLLPGEYEVAFTLDAGRAAGNGTAPIRLDVLSGGRCLAERMVGPAARGRAVWRLPVAVDAVLANAEGRMALEFRVWTDGSLPFAVLSVQTRRLARGKAR